jgi:two-component system NtrC family response regulator
MTISILIIDDEEKLRSLLRRIISLEGYIVSEAGTLAQAREILAQRRTDIVLCDVKLPDGNGVAFSAELKKMYPALPVILLTAFGNIHDGVTAIKNGANDYLVKGDDNGKIIPLLAHLSEVILQEGRIKQVHSTGNTRAGFGHIIGESPQLRSAIKLAQKVATTETAVLLIGETGTGKEIFAEALHRNSKRSGQPFTAINCSTFSKELLESELFGHKAGAFTGATKDKKGLVEETKGGTLFLDEIGEMSLDLQPKLLRLLENGTYFRVGDAREYKSDIRIIAATNRNLKQEIEQGLFRSDLYYRVAVFTIALPPLRERAEDILPLAQHYLRLYAAKTEKKITAISREAESTLITASWMGNIRELRNAIERAVILEDSDMLTTSGLPLDLLPADPKQNTLSDLQLQHVEKQHIQKVMAYTHSNKSEAARLMGIGLATLYRKLDEYGLK